MKLGRVIGRVVSTQKLDCFEGIKLLLVQPLDEHLAASGTPLVAMDTVQAGQGDTIYYEASKEAGQALTSGQWFHPGDTAVIAIIDEIDGVEKKGGKA